MSQEQLSNFGDEPKPSLQEAETLESKFQPYQPSEEDKELITEAAAAWNERLTVLEKEIHERGIKGRLNESIFTQEFYSQHYPDVNLWVERVFSYKGVTKNEDGTTTILINPWTLTRFGSEAAKMDAMLQFRAQYPHAGGEAQAFCMEHVNQTSAERYIAAARLFTDTMFEARFMDTDEVLRGPLTLFGAAVVSMVLTDSEEILQAWSEFMGGADLTNAITGENGEVMDDTIAACLRFVHEVILGYKQTGVFYDAYAAGDNRIDEVEDEFAVFGPDAPFFREVQQQQLEHEKLIEGDDTND